MAPKRKRKRVYNWGAILVALLLPVVAAGIYFSPITSLTKVRVVGARPEDQSALATAIATLKDRPYFLANGRNVESLAMNVPEIKSASLARNLFGRGVLTVTYREPIARIFGAPNLAMDGTGAIYRCRNVDESLPAVQFMDGLPEASAALSGTAPTLAVADLARQARIDPAMQGLPERRIGVFNNGSLCLNIGAARVEFGSHYELDRKFKVLIDLMEKDPTLLNRAKTLNLVDPNRPAMVPLSNENRP